MARKKSGGPRGAGRGAGRRGKSGNGRRRSPVRQSAEVLYTLSEVSKLTKISMPTLQRYKKSCQDRIPSRGEGRRQRYPHVALAVFKEIKKENISRRGRPRKDTSAPTRPAAGRRGPRRRGPETSASGLLTLTTVGKKTGISYPTLVRYVKLFGDQIPSEGAGRRRRYHPEAVAVFRRLRAESPRGRKKGSGSKGAVVSSPSPSSSSSSGRDMAAVSARLKALEQSHSRLENQLRELVRSLKKPVRITVHRV